MQCLPRDDERFETRSSFPAKSFQETHLFVPPHLGRIPSLSLHFLTMRQKEFPFPALVFSFDDAFQPNHIRNNTLSSVSCRGFESVSNISEPFSPLSAVSKMNLLYPMSWLIWICPGGGVWTTRDPTVKKRESRLHPVIVSAASDALFSLGLGAIFLAIRTRMIAVIDL